MAMRNDDLSEVATRAQNSERLLAVRENKYAEEVADLKQMEKKVLGYQQLQQKVAELNALENKLVRLVQHLETNGIVTMYVVILYNIFMIDINWISRFI
jgi:hypothetical protein